ncbi:MAG: ABC transporter C-terminal domain-containing protein [Chitinophagaceae bacterium]
MHILEKEIEALQTEKAIIEQQLNTTAIPYEQLQQLSTRISYLTETIDAKEMRWLQLSEVV